MPEDAVATEGKSPALGVWSLVCGLIAALGVLMIGQASFGWVPTFDPAGLLRIVTAWMMPIGIIGAVILGALSVRRGSGRPFGIAGVVLALLSVGAFIAMIVSVDY